MDKGDKANHNCEYIHPVNFCVSFKVCVQKVADIASYIRRNAHISYVGIILGIIAMYIAGMHISIIMQE